MGFRTIRLLHDPLNQDLPVSLGRRVETGWRWECRKLVHQHGGVASRSSGFLIYIQGAEKAKHHHLQSTYLSSREHISDIWNSGFRPWNLAILGLLLSELVAVPKWVPQRTCMCLSFPYQLQPPVTTPCLVETVLTTSCLLKRKSATASPPTSHCLDLSLEPWYTFFMPVQPRYTPRK